MNLLPVIERELRGASRQQASWLLRLALATGAVLACVFGLLLPHPLPQNRGQVVLVCLVVSGLALSLFAGAYLTADSVSAEKRGGTLGLLFLTPLTGWQIVLGKMPGHSLQVGLLMGWPWIGFAGTFLVAIQANDNAVAAASFAGWAVCCLLFDAWLINRCRAWLRMGLRRRVSEAG